MFPCLTKDVILMRILAVCAFFLPLGLFAQSWGQVASMPSGKHHPVTFAINEYGYAITGTNSSDLPTNDVYRYDPNSNQWTELSSFPGSSRSFAIGQEYNGKGYLGFGASLTSYFNDIWEFDPNINSWSLLTTCECSGRRHPAFVIRNDKIYVGLGDDATGDLDDWHIYDMNTDTWSQAPDLPANGRHHPFMFPAGDNLFAGMGHSGSLIYGDWYMFNITTETWQPMSDFPGEHRVAGTQFGHQGKGYVLSGDGSNHSFMPTGEFWEYDPDLDSWNELDPHPGISRWAPGSFVIDGAVYFMGGENRQTDVIQNDVWTYQLTFPTSTANAESRHGFKLYPNPARNVVMVESSSNQNTLLTIFGLNGKPVLEQNINQRATIDVSSLSAGVYLIALQSSEKTVYEKLLVQ